MEMDHLEHFIDLRRTDIDPEVFAAALAIYHVRTLIVSGGSSIERPDIEAIPSPRQIEAFLGRAFSSAQKTKRFEHEWRSLQQAISLIQMAWEFGQACFREILVRATDRPEEMEYLTHIDFAADCYAYPAAVKTYPQDRALQAWCRHGFMLAWQHYFFPDGDAFR